MTLTASVRAETGNGDTASDAWIGPTLERVAKSFSTIAPKDGGRARSAAAFKIEWPPDVLLNDRMIEREEHEAAARLLRDYAHGYGSLGGVGGYGERTGGGLGLVYDKRLDAVTHRKGLDLGIRAKRRHQFDVACQALRHADTRQPLIVAALTAICGLSPIDGAPYMTFTRLGEWYVPPVQNEKQRAMAGKILVKQTCQALREHYEAA